MRQHPVRIRVATMVVVYGLLFATILMGKSPKLGLDLQGGISVNLQPVEKGKVIDNVSDEQFDQAIEIIRKRVDALGVAEPEVSRQGNTISVQLPGAKDQAEVLAVVGSTAQLEFRPVLAIVGKLPTGKAKTKADETVAKLRKELGVPDGVTAAQVVADEQAKSPIPATDPAAAPADATIVTEPAATETTAPETTVAASGGGRSVMAGRSTTQTPPGADPVPTSDAATTGTTTTTVPPTPLNQWGVNFYDPKFAELYQTETQLAAELTPTDEQSPEAEVTLKGEDGTVYKLGPVAVDGRAVKGATASLGQDGKWTVNPSFKAGVDNIDAFNAIAAKCYAGDPTCPDQGGGKGQLGIVLDGVVLSAPTINTPSFDADSIQISGSFTKDEAESLCVALRYC